MKKARSKGKLATLNARRAALHKRRLKLDESEAKLRKRLELVLAKQVIYADRYNKLVYQISQLGNSN